MSGNPNATLTQPTPLLDPHRLVGWEESRRRRRMLEGTWGEDLRTEMVVRTGVKRTDRLGKLSRALNLFRSTVDQTSTTYDIAPEIEYQSDDEPDPEAVDVMRDVLDDAMWWQLAAQNARYTNGLRNSLVNVVWADDTEAVRYRLVTADTVEVVTDPDDPFTLREVVEVRQRENPDDGKPGWYYDVWKLDGDGGGSLSVVNSAGEDFTAAFLGDEAGTYPWVDDDGVAFLPWVKYDAQPGTRPFDPFELCELVDGSFEVGVLWNFYAKAMKDASFEQRALVDGEPLGVSTAPSGYRELDVDPMALLQVSSKPDKTASLTSWRPSVDVEKFAQAVLLYQRTMIDSMGISSSDMEKTASESGVAIKLRRSAQRRLAKKQEPMFRRGDESLLMLTALVNNAFSDGETLPVDGWGVTYQYIEDPVEERVAELEYRKELMAQGLISRTRMYLLTHPNSTEEQARESIVQAALENTWLDRVVSASVLEPEDAAALDSARERAVDALLSDDLDPNARAILEQVAGIGQRQTDQEPTA